MSLPKVATHSRLGELELDELIAYYKGEVVIPNGRKVTLQVAAHDDEPLTELLDLSSTTLDKALEFIDDASRYAAKILTPIHNEGWTDDKPEISEADFARRINLETICVTSGGSIDYTYSDDDLFWGHYVRVEYIEEEGFFNALFEG